MQAANRRTMLGTSSTCANKGITIFGSVSVDRPSTWLKVLFSGLLWLTDGLGMSNAGKNFAMWSMSPSLIPSKYDSSNWTCGESVVLGLVIMTE